MNDFFKNIIDENKELINYVHLLFVYLYKIESKKGLDNIESRIVSSMFEVFQDKECMKYIDNIYIQSAGTLKYKMNLFDYLGKHWSFEIDVKESSAVQLLSYSSVLTSSSTACVFFISSFEYSELDLGKGNVFILSKKNVSKEDIEMINLKCDIDISVFDLNDVAFKHVDSLKFIKGL